MNRRAKAREADAEDTDVSAGTPLPQRRTGSRRSLPLFLGSLVSMSVIGLMIGASTLQRHDVGDAVVNADAAAEAAASAALPSPLPIRYVRIPGAESDDDAEALEAEDDDDGVASMLQRLRRLAGQAAVKDGGTTALSASRMKGATVIAPLSKRNPVLAAECARRMSGSALMDFDRVLMPPPPPSEGSEDLDIDAATEGAAEGVAAAPHTTPLRAPPAQVPAPPGASDFAGRVLPTVHTLPQAGVVGGLRYFRPLTLLLDEQHLLIGDLFLASSECVVFVTVKNKAQPDWLLLRRLLIEYAGDNETIVTPFTSVASSVADPREPVGVGKFCYKGFSRSRSVDLVIIYRGQRWPVTVHRPGGRGSSQYAMTTLVGHNWRLLPAWVAYWKKLGAGHFYLYFNDYLVRVFGDGPDGAALLSYLRSVADFVTVYEWPFKFDVRIKVEKAGGEERLRLQHLAQPLRAHSAFYRYRSAHRYMLYFDVDEYLVPTAPGSRSLVDIIHGTARAERLTPVYSFSNRWAVTGSAAAPTGLLRLPALAAAGVYSDVDVVLGKRTKYAVATRSKVVFLHIHKATTGTEYVRAATHHVPPSVASFLHLTNLDPCHGSLDVDAVAAQSALTTDPERRDVRMNELLLLFSAKRDAGRATMPRRVDAPVASLPLVPEVKGTAEDVEQEEEEDTPAGRGPHRGSVFSRQRDDEPEAPPLARPPAPPRTSGRHSDEEVDTEGMAPAPDEEADDETAGGISAPTLPSGRGTRRASGVAVAEDDEGDADASPIESRHKPAVAAPAGARFADESTSTAADVDERPLEPARGSARLRRLASAAVAE